MFFEIGSPKTQANVKFNHGDLFFLSFLYIAENFIYCGILVILVRFLDFLDQILLQEMIQIKIIWWKLNLQEKQLHLIKPQSGF